MGELTRLGNYFFDKKSINKANVARTHCITDWCESRRAIDVR